MTTKTNAYVKDGRLVILGVTATGVGAIPFAFDCPVPEGTPDGPLDVGAEPPEALKETLGHAHREVGKQVSGKRLRVEAEHLVLRARNGDQNAMAMLIGIRDSANAGVPRAQRALAVVQRFIENHPVGDDTEFGSESEKESSLALKKHVATDDPTHYCLAVLTLMPHADSDKAITLIANGPLVDKPLLQLVSSGLPDDEREQFEAGFTGKIDAISDAARLGYVFSKARKLQAARRGRLDLYCPVVAWEIGL